ncbi:DUF1566 domain-containing protein [candidate division KSB1 bacterium]|nr:DUF1566 domain-containing protein [candidate division KSB1 bacterium]
MLDPSTAEEPRLVFSPRENLFEVIDSILSHPAEHRYLIMLADAGMGKTAFLLNYYVRHRRKRRRRYELALVPLGIPNADKYIEQIENKPDTVLFLDAFDEDTLAIVDHAARLRDLLMLTRNFSRVLITCRKQFFPKEEEIPRETGIVRVGPLAAGENAEYVFHKLYLSPFTDVQAKAYLRQRFPIWQFRRRKLAQMMIENIPELKARPMLLAYIEDLVYTEPAIKYSIELYEMLVEAWLAREESKVYGLRKEQLSQFSESLAVDLYINREHRGAERIPREELAVLAKEWGIPLEDWQLSGRSLLNRDAEGNYKFAHRSVMEYLFVRRAIKNEKARKKVEWTDQMKVFLREMVRKCVAEQKLIPFRLTPARSISLRSDPCLNLKAEDLSIRLKQLDFYDTKMNTAGKGLIAQLEVLGQPGVELVVDFETGLMWQKSGSDSSMPYKGAEKHLCKLNQQNWGGYDDWRIPTIEEAMSLITPIKSCKLYHSPIFSDLQRVIWTSDKINARTPWVVAFDPATCYTVSSDFSYYVRFVRSG